MQDAIPHTDWRGAVDEDQYNSKLHANGRLISRMAKSREKNQGIFIRVRETRVLWRS